MERTKMELELNSPKTVEILFDKCIVGENRYGAYYLYAMADVKTGEELSFFAPDDAHEQLKRYGQGDKVILTKTAEQKNKKVIVRYNVTPYQNGKAVNEAMNTMPVNGNGQKANGTQPQNGNGKSNGVHIHDERLFFVEMLQSFEDAAKIQREYQGADLNRTAITLFISRSKSNGSPAYPA